MQKIFSILIAGFMFASFILNDLSVSAKEKYIEYIVPFYSDKINQNRVIGISNESLLKNGIVLIPLKTACEIAGASIKAENDDAVIISRNYVSWCCQYNDKKNQYLLVDSNTGEGDFYESSLKCLAKPSWSGVSFKYAIDCVGDHAGIVTLPVDNSYKTEIDYEFYNNELYVSFYDFLVMMGVDVNIAGRDIQLELVESFLYNMGIDVTDNNVNTLVDYIFAQVMGEYDLNLFFSCCLSTPVDELYMNYYEKQKDLYMCDLTDYYSDGDVKWANLVNSMASFNGITETVLASMNLNTDYSEVLVNIVSNVGMNSSQNNDSDLMLQGALEGINSNATEENKKDWNLQKTSFLLQYGWDTESLTSGIINDMDDIFNKIVYNAQGYKFEGIDLGTADGISIAFGAFTTGLEYYDKYKALNTLFDNDENLLKNSILCSDYLKQSMQDEFGDDFISKGRKFIGRGAVFNENLLNTSDSYINLYRSASEIQLLMETSAPATWGAIQKAYKNAAMATLDTIILKTIDGFAFTGVPVTEFAVQFIQYVSKEISNQSYVKQKSKIAEFDNFVFVQEVAKGCFNSFDLSSENAFSSFVLGVKASLTAYEAENEIRKSSNIENRIEMLKSMLDQTTFANKDFYRINIDRCSDLTEMIGENTDISKLDNISFEDTLIEDYSESINIIIGNDNKSDYNKKDNYSGNYSNSEFSVDVDVEKNSIRIECDKFGSTVKNICDISNCIEFTAKDNSGINNYILEFEDDLLKLSMKQLEITNLLSGRSIPDIDVELPKTSDVPKDYSISSWSVEMIVDAINIFLEQEDELGLDKYELNLSDVYGDEGIIRYKNDGQDAKKSVSWGDDDYAWIYSRHSCGIITKFHLKDYLDEKKYQVKKTWTDSLEINIEDYYGKYIGNQVYLELRETTEERKDNHRSVEAYIRMTLQNGNRVGVDIGLGYVDNNIIVLRDKHDFFITIKDDKLFFSCYCISDDEYFKEMVNQELNRIN